MSGVAVLTFSRIARDGRVLRQCDLVAEMGTPPHVIAFGEPGDVIAYPHSLYPTPQPSTAHRLDTVLRQLPAHLGGMAAQAGFWRAARFRWALDRLREVAPGLVIANDWPALVVGARYKRESGARLHYDSHEFSPMEFNESAWWRMVHKPFVRQLERSSIGAADSISTVGPRLADELQSHYRLVERPAVIRNMPNRMSGVVNTATQWPLRILYHGHLLPDRGLEVLIDTAKAWNIPHTLTLRGNGPDGYVNGLRQRAAALQAMGRVQFVPAVPPHDVMRVAAETADLGVFFTPLGTAQRHFSLPNKLFEYIGAGLAVAVTPGHDLKTVVESHHLGVVSADDSAPAVAAAISGLTASSVAIFRANAQKAAAILCWENEKHVLRNVLERFEHM